MALRFFADHCISNLIIRTLAHAGHEVLRLKDHLPVESPDSVVIAKAQHDLPYADCSAAALAQARQAALVTSDKDLEGAGAGLKILSV